MNEKVNKCSLRSFCLLPDGRKLHLLPVPKSLPLNHLPYELLSVELPDEYKKESWQMDAEEKLNSVPSLKDEGNRLYGEKKYVEATAKYGDAIGRLEQLMLR